MIEKKERTKNPGDFAWGTKQELNYINTIGEALNKREGVPQGTTSQYLQGYLKACKKRVNWNNIDKDICVKMANEQLGKLRNGY